jgi:hypothetical protein
MTPQSQLLKSIYGITRTDLKYTQAVIIRNDESMNSEFRGPRRLDFHWKSKAI